MDEDTQPSDTVPSSISVASSTGPSSVSEAPEAAPPSESATLALGEITYTRHPLSALFPDPDPDSYALLKSSIQATGQQRPIALLTGNVVLDGWTRLRACAQIGVEPKFEIVPEGADLTDKVIALSLAQRILSASQRALIAADLAKLKRGGDRTGAGRPLKMGSAKHTTESSTDDESMHRDNDENNQSPKLDFDFAAHDGRTALGDIQSQRPATEVSPNDSVTLKSAADRLGVSRAYAALAKKVSTGADPALSDAVRAGKISLGEAYEVATKQPRQSHAAWLAERIKLGTSQAKKEARDAAPESKVLAKQVRELRRIPPGRTKDDVAGVLIAEALTATASINLLGEFIARGDFPGDDPNLGRLHDAVKFFNESIESIRIPMTSEALK
jgi:ParB-like chromosome segregation protein Spo0J